MPSVKIKSIENIKFTEYEISVTDKEIKNKIDEIAKNQNNFKEKKDNESAANGDLVAFDYEATIENKSFEGGQGKNTQIVLGKDLFLKGFDKQLVGVKKNQERKIDAILPDNYPIKEFANKKAIFKCKILNVKKTEPVVIDDQFAKNLGAKDLNDLKQLVKKQIQNQYKMSLDAISKENILNQLEKIHDIILPENLVKQELELISRGLKKEDAEKNLKDSEKIAKKRIKLGLILNELGEKNSLKVSDQELKGEIQKQVQSMPGQEKQVLEFYQKNQSAAASLRGTIYEEKILNLIKEKSKKTKKIVTINEAEEILQKESHQHDDTRSSVKKKEDVKKSKKTTKTLKKIRKK